MNAGSATSDRMKASDLDLVQLARIERAKARLAAGDLLPRAAIFNRHVVQRLADAFAESNSTSQLFANLTMNCFGRSFGKIDAATGQMNVTAGAGTGDQAVGIDHDGIGALARLLNRVVSTLAKNGDVWLHASRMHGCSRNCNARSRENFEGNFVLKWRRT